MIKGLVHFIHWPTCTCFKDFQVVSKKLASRKNTMLAVLGESSWISTQQTGIFYQYTTRHFTTFKHAIIRLLLRGHFSGLKGACLKDIYIVYPPSDAKNMLGYLSSYMYMICSEKWTVFQEQCLKKIVSFKDTIMCKDKYPSLHVFLRQMGAFVFLFLQILFTTHQVMLKLGISLGYCPVLAGTYSVMWHN